MESGDESGANDGTGEPSRSDPTHDHLDTDTESEIVTDAGPVHGPADSETNAPHTHATGDEDEKEVDEWVLLTRDVVTSIGAVVLLGAYLFAISGVWPPMVAIESGSMEPNMDINDLVFVMETDRFQPAAATGDTGVVPASVGEETGYYQFGDPGDVIVFAPNGDTGQTPIIHRAMFWVEEGEDWVAKADESYLGSVDTCADIPRACPAPHDGFITKGDKNRVYDQVQANEPVKPAWIVGTAEQRVPGLGWLRLRFQ